MKYGAIIGEIKAVTDFHIPAEDKVNVVLALIAEYEAKATDNRMGERRKGDRRA